MQGEDVFPFAFGAVTAPEVPAPRGHFCVSGGVGLPAPREGPSDGRPSRTPPGWQAWLRVGRVYKEKETELAALAWSLGREATLLAESGRNCQRSPPATTLPSLGGRPAGVRAATGQSTRLGFSICRRDTLSGAGSEAERPLRPLGIGPTFGQQGSVHQGGLTASSAGWPLGPGMRRGPGWQCTCFSLWVLPVAAGAQTESTAGAGQGSEKGSSPNVSSLWGSDCQFWSAHA